MERKRIAWLTAVVIVMTAIATLISDGLDDFAFIGSAGLLSAACAVPIIVATRFRPGRGTYFDHPSTITAMVLTCYWLLAGLYARYSHSFICVGAREHTSAALFAGTVAALGFYLGAGLPPANDHPQGALTKPGASLWWVLYTVLFGIRIFEMRKGVYFTHKFIAPHDSTPIEAVLDNAVYTLRVAPCVLSVGLWLRGKRFLAAAMLIAETVFVLFTGSRLFVLHVGVLTAMAVSLTGKRLQVGWAVPVMVVFIVVVNPFIRTMRQAMRADTSEAPTTLDVASATMAYGGPTNNEDAVDELMSRGSAVSYLANTMCFSEMVGLGSSPLNGTTYADSTLLLVPKVIWPEKPPLPGADLVGVMNARLGVRPQDAVASPVAEAYLNFGYIGVFIAYVVLGLIGRVLWAFRMAYADSLSAGGVYLMSMTVFALFETHSTIGMLTGLRIPAVLILGILAYTAVNPARRLIDSNTVPNV